MCPYEEVPRFPFSYRGDRIAPELAGRAEHRPVSRVRANSGDLAWLVTGHREVRQVLEDDDRFSLARTAGPTAPQQDPVPPPASFSCFDRLMRKAGMREVLLRGLGAGQQHVTPAQVERATRDALRTMTRQGGEGDLVGQVCLPVAATVTCLLLGLPAEDAPRLEPCFAVLWSGTDPSPLPLEATHLDTYMTQQLARLRRSPEGLLGDLVARHDQRRVLSDGELTEICTVLLLSGLGNPASLLAFSAFSLLREPRLLATLGARPWLVPRAVEELLRVSVMLGDGLARIAVEDVEVGGEHIRAGDLVLVSPDAANADPGVFTDPGRLDLGRDTRRHVRFGRGRHRCPGAAVTRMLARAYLRVLVEELPGMRLTVSPESVKWRTQTAVTLPVALPVTWAPSPARR